MALSLNAADMARERVLVLGFDAPCLNDIQSRMLREMIMKDVREKGYEIVTVMDLEQLKIGGIAPDLRRPGKNDIIRLMKILAADYAIAGKFFSETGTCSEIITGKKYRCVCSVFLGNYSETKIEVDAVARPRLYEFYKEISLKTTDALLTIIKK
jgi:hypothetical protein